MGIGDYLSAKAESAMMLGATGFAQANPAALLQIGAMLDTALHSATITGGEGDKAQDILESLMLVVRLEQVDHSATQTEYDYMRIADFHRNAGDKAGMYAASMLAALYRRAVPAAKGRPKDLAHFEEMAAAIASAIAVYRSSKPYDG